MNAYQKIIDTLPYRKPFRFVDEITHLDENNAEGHYTLSNDEYFYQGHFPGNPITPGVIIQEVMAQIGLVCLGLWLTRDQVSKGNMIPVFSSAQIDFTAQVKPGERLIVHSEKIYFRFNKLKCKISCRLADDRIVAKGVFSGMIINKSDFE